MTIGIRYAFISLVLVSAVSALFWSSVVAAVSHWFALDIHAGAIIGIGAGIFVFIFAAAAGLMLDGE
jgi:hypothetical protein